MTANFSIVTTAEAQPELPQTAGTRPESETVDSGQLPQRLAQIEAEGGFVESMARKSGSAVWTITCHWPGLTP